MLRSIPPAPGESIVATIVAAARAIAAAFVAASLMSALAARASASELPSAAPEEVGFSTRALEAVSQFAERNVEQGKHAGMVTMIARHGKIVHYEATGVYGVDDDKPMQRDSLFRIYSMTKPITSVAMMMLYEQGLFHMHDPVAKHLPALGRLQVYAGEDARTEARSQMTIEQLLTHTAGLTYGFRPDDPVDALYRKADPFQSRDLEEFVDRVASLPLRFQPGTRYHYSIATDLVGALVEELSGQSLEEYFQKHIFAPLQMEDTFFNVPEDKLPRLATHHGWDRENDRISRLPPALERPYTDVTLFSGGGGLVSSAMDYMVFCEMLRRGGSFGRARLLGPKTVQWMTMNHLTEEVRNEGAHEYPESHLYPGQGFGLGFGVIMQPGLSQVVSSAGEYSWGGAADTKFWVDPQEDLVAIVLTQLLGSPWETRYEMKVATYQALVELAGD